MNVKTKVFSVITAFVLSFGSVGTAYASPADNMQINGINTGYKEYSVVYNENGNVVATPLYICEANESYRYQINSSVVSGMPVLYNVGTYRFDWDVMVDGWMVKLGGDYNDYANITVIAKEISTCGITLESSTFTYTGTPITPVIVNNGQTYTVNGDTSATAVGKYTITLTGNGNYTGTTTLNWTITEPEPIINPEPIIEPIVNPEPIIEPIVNPEPAPTEPIVNPTPIPYVPPVVVEDKIVGEVYVPVYTVQNTEDKGSIESESVVMQEENNNTKSNDMLPYAVGGIGTVLAIVAGSGIYMNRRKEEEE